MNVSMAQVFKAVDYANSHPDKYLNGTTNWCAAVAFDLNRQASTAPKPPALGGEPEIERFEAVSNYRDKYGEKQEHITQCSAPRTSWNGQQFRCPQCGWVSGFPADFIAEYRAKWNLSEARP